MNNQDAFEKGRDGEMRFCQWLDQNKLPYVYVRQEPIFFSTLFVEGTKRPDFLILIQSIGLLAVDVKNKNIKSPYNTLTLDKTSEISQALNFERVFRIPFWFTYLDNRSGNIVWHWISAMQAAEIGCAKESDKAFFEFQESEVVTITDMTDMGKLFSSCLQTISPLTISLARKGNL